MKQQHALGLAATLVGLLSTTALAQQTADGGVIDLGTLVITGAPTASNIADLPADVDVVTGEEKRRRQGASLGDTLDHLSGVDTIATGTNVGKPVLRGFSGNRVRVLSNGIGLDFQQFGVRHMPTVDPFVADRIEVVRGAQSLLYGSGALGGAVNLLPSLPPTGPEGEWTLNGETTLDYQSAYEQITGVQKLSGANGRLGFAATIIGRDSDGLETPNAPLGGPGSGNPSGPLVTGDVPFTDYEQVNGDINIGYMTDIGQIRLRYEGYRDEHNFLVPDPPPPNGNPLQPGGVGQKIENDLIQLDADLAINDTWTLKPKLSFASNLRVSNPGPPEPLPRSLLPGAKVIDIERDTYTARLEAEHTGLFGALDGRIGFEAVNTDQSSRGPTILSPGGQVENYALFAFEEAEMGDLKLNFGGRVDYRETELDLSQTAGTSPRLAALTPDQRENDYLVATGGLGASYAVTENLSLMGNLSRGFRAPNLFELYADGVHGGVAAVQRGNPNLDEETSISLDAGVRWESDTLSAKATAYYNDIEDYIFLTDVTPPAGPTTFQVSQQNAETYGLDVTVEGRPLHWLTWRTTLSWVDGELSDGTQVPLLPPLKVSGEVTLHKDRVGAFEDAYLTLGAKYADSQNSAGLIEPFGQFDTPPPPFGTASTDDYVLLDATIGGTIATTGTEVEFGVENILDEDYRDFLDTYKNITLGPGRNWTLRVTQRF